MITTKQEKQKKGTQGLQNYMKGNTDSVLNPTKPVKHNNRIAVDGSALAFKEMIMPSACEMQDLIIKR